MMKNEDRASKMKKKNDTEQIIEKAMKGYKKDKRGPINAEEIKKPKWTKPQSD